MHFPFFLIFFIVWPLLWACVIKINCYRRLNVQSSWFQTVSATQRWREEGASRVLLKEREINRQYVVCFLKVYMCTVCICVCVHMCMRVCTWADGGLKQMPRLSLHHSPLYLVRQELLWTHRLSVLLSAVRLPQGSCFLPSSFRDHREWQRLSSFLIWVLGTWTLVSVLALW